MADPPEVLEENLLVEHLAVLDLHPAQFLGGERRQRYASQQVAALFEEAATGEV